MIFSLRLIISAYPHNATINKMRNAMYVVMGKCNYEKNHSLNAKNIYNLGVLKAGAG